MAISFQDKSIQQWRVCIKMLVKTVPKVKSFNVRVNKYNSIQNVKQYYKDKQKMFKKCAVQFFVGWEG